MSYATACAEVIVYVHGLWQTGREALWLRHRLASALGAEALAFSYRSMAADVTESAAALGGYLRALNVATLHLVGHSLGGLIILKLFEDELGAALPPGRIVLLGSPVRGCRTARNLARVSWGRRILGRAIREAAAVPGERRWRQRRELGVVAGDWGVGLGRLVGSLPAPSDGTVSVAETELPGATDRIVLKVSHTGMLFSGKVSRQTAAFLAHGRFER